MSTDLKACTEQLSAEHRLLMQLIYRNHNQHASSHLFSYFKNLNRVLKHLTPERVNVTATKCEATLRSAAQGKVTQSDLLEMNEVLVLLFAVVNMTAQGLDFSLKASDLVRHLLSKKLFLPLYTMLLAISARIVHCLSDIFKHFSTQCNALTLQLQHIALLNPRLAKFVSTMLAHPDASFTSQVAVIQARLTPAPPAETATTSKATRSEPETSLKDSRNISTASLMSLGSQGEAKYSAATSEVEEGVGCQDSDGEDAGLPMNSGVGVSVGAAGGVVGTLTPSVSCDVLHKPVTPGKATSAVTIGTTTNHQAATTTTSTSTNINTSTDFDSLFSAPTTSVTSSSSKVVVTKKIKTGATTSAAASFASTGTTDKKSDKKVTTATTAITTTATSISTSSSAKIKSKDGERKEKKEKSSSKVEKGGDKNKKRKSETADDIDDIFGF